MPASPQGVPAHGMGARCHGFLPSSPLDIPAIFVDQPQGWCKQAINRLDALDPTQLEDCLADGMQRSGGAGPCGRFSFI